MKTKYAVLPALAFGLAAMANAQAPTKVGIIHIQNAILSTKDGQKAANDLKTRFEPKKSDLDKKQAQIASLQDQMRKGSATMSEEKKQQLARDIDSSTKSLNRETEDAQAELDQEQGKIMQDLGGKIMAVIDKYAKDNGFAVILDVSNPQTPVLWAANGIDITTEIVSLYDKNAPAAPASRPATSATPASRPATPGASPATRPAVPTVPPAAKKK